jgi:putative endonuclease
MKYFVFAIRSLKDIRIYIGMSEDVQKRLQEHNSGSTKSTKGYLPLELVYVEECQDRILARSREKFYKSGSGKAALRRVVAAIPKGSDNVR